MAWKHLSGAQPRFLLIAGDLVNGDSPDEFRTLMTDLDENLYGIPVASAMGNHDYITSYANNKHSVESPRDYLNWEAQRALTLEQPCAERREGWGLFRFYGIQVICMDCCWSSKSFRFSDEQLEWLDAALSESDGERFRIVISHLQLMTYPVGARTRCRIDNDRRIQSLLDKHGRVILLSGHTHSTLRSLETNICFDDIAGNAYVNCGSVGNAIPEPRTVKALKPMLKPAYANADMNLDVLETLQALTCSGSMGIQADVRHHSIVFRGVDFLTGDYLQQCMYSIPL